MSGCCESGCGNTGPAPVDIAFGVEMIGGHATGSMALQADALDFGADAATYGITLWAIGRSAGIRTRAALIKSAAMLPIGLFVLAMAVVQVIVATPPQPAPMGVIGARALAVNLGAVVLLLRFRHSDANLRSVWLSSRNEAFGNGLVIAAACATAVTQSPWPDIAVGVTMPLLFVCGSWSDYRQVRRELAAQLAGTCS